MQAALRFLLSLGLCVALLLTARSSAKAQTSIQFTLDKSYTTSAGAYKPDGTLVRTLWRKVPYAAGTHSATWDGKDDKGAALPAGQYQIKVLYHNMQYVWDGAIGNTSQEHSGASVHTAFRGMRDMAIVGSKAFYCTGYNESGHSFQQFETSNPRRRTFSFGWVYRTQSGEEVNTYDNIYGRMWSQTTADNEWVYFGCLAGIDGATGNNNQPGFVTAVRVSDSKGVSFTNGQNLATGPAGNSGWTGAPQFLKYHGVAVGNQPGLSGLAVQKNGNILAVAVAPENKVYLLDKRGGNVLRVLTVPAPKRLAMAPNGDLWVVTATTVVRYTNLSTNPTVAATLTGFSKPLAVAVHPTQNLVLVADGGSSQQIKAYTNTGAPLWTYGQAGGYATNGADVRLDKLWFYNGESDNRQEDTFIAFQPNGSFWVGDGGNNRNLHLSAGAAPSYLDQIAWQPATYVMAVDPTTPTRVTYGLLEFLVDYSRPIGQAWTLVKNWGAGLGPEYLGDFSGGISQVATLPNGRTYAFVENKTLPGPHAQPEVVELTGNRLRPTGALLPAQGRGNEVRHTLAADGTLRSVEVNTTDFHAQALTGFDGAGNPQWATRTPLATAPTGNQDPVPRCCSFGRIAVPVTSTGVVVSFDQSKNNGWHLGGIKTGGTEWLWKASPSGALDGKGSYDIGNGVNYGGNTAMAQGRNIVFGYHGEFWKDAQANQWMHFYDNGLFVGQFGESSLGNGEGKEAREGFAGNSFSPALVETGGETYLWMNDEWGHGLQRWHLTGINTIRELTGQGSLGSVVQLADLPARFPVHVTPTPGNRQVKLTWSPVLGASSYTVKYSLTPGGPYTVAAASTTGPAFTISNLTNATDYYLVVAATTATGAGPNSEEVLAKPFDPNVAVHAAGQFSNDSNNEFAVSSGAPATGQPALQLTSPLGYSANNLMLEEVGRKGYAIYNWGGAGLDNATVRAPFVVSKNNGWRNDEHASFRFRVDNQLGSTGSLFSDPAGSLNVTVSDSEWHYLTAFCPARFEDARHFTVTLTAQGQPTSAVTYAVDEELGRSHVFQFRFKGNVSLTTSNQGDGGTLQAVFLDNVAMSPTLTGMSPSSGAVGTTVTITGTNLSGATSVIFNGGNVVVPASAISANSATQLTVQVPAGATTGAVLVVTPTGVATSPQIFTVTAITPPSLPDLVVTAAQLIPAGAYHNITVAATGEAQLGGAVTVNGAFVVQSGGKLSTSCQPLTGSGTFTLAAHATLTICDAQGISQSGPAGAIQVSGSRQFSPAATYIYTGSAGQTTGSGLPARVRNLVIASTGSGVVLSQPVAVRQTLRFEGGDLQNGQLLTLLSDADSTAVVAVGPAGGTAVGNVTVQRYLAPALHSGPGYHYLAAPVTNATVADLATSSFSPVVNSSYNSSATPATVSPFPTVFEYDEARQTTSPAASLSAFDKGWFSPATTAAALPSGQGFRVQVAATETMDFVGTLGTGNVSLNLTRGLGPDAGWNLLGNPYPAVLDWRTVVVPTALEPALYVYQSTSASEGRYRAYVNGIGNPLVAMGQGFFVRVRPTTSTATLTLTNQNRTTTSAVEVQGAPETRPLVQLTLAAQGAAPHPDQAYVYFQAGASSGPDPQYDAVKLPNSNGLNLSCVVAGSLLAIKGLPLPTPGTIVPLSVTVPAAGTYVLTAAQLLNLGPLPVYLHDNATNQDINLRQQASYTFTVAGPTDASSRFSVRFEASQPLTVRHHLTASSVSIYPNPARQSFTVRVPAVPGSKQVHVMLFNSLGQAVRQQQVPLLAAGARVPFEAAGLPAGVYLLRVQAAAETFTQRIVLE